jgi:hypothetical protein
MGCGGGVWQERDANIVGCDDFCCNAQVIINAQCVGTKTKLFSETSNTTGPSQ